MIEVMVTLPKDLPQLPRLKRWHKIVISTLLGCLVAAGTMYLVAHFDYQVLDTKGVIGDKERDLIVFVTLLSLVVVLPVFFMLFFIAWRYREGSKSKKKNYQPDWDHSAVAETIWWGLPFVIILILSSVIWTTSHNLDPFKPLASGKEPINVQVVALQWRWLFIYPDDSIATINDLRFPVDTPVNFTITADAPMNSFWIPKLGSQVYAMNGMSTQLHLMASETGSYDGSSANISGAGFANMKFKAVALSDSDYATWLKNTKSTGTSLDWKAYQEIAKAVDDTKKYSYRLDDTSLYDKIIDKYMSSDAHTMSDGTETESSDMSTMEGM